MAKKLFLLLVVFMAVGANAIFAQGAAPRMAASSANGKAQTTATGSTAAPQLAATSSSGSAANSHRSTPAHIAPKLAAGDKSTEPKKK